MRKFADTRGLAWNFGVHCGVLRIAAGDLDLAVSGNLFTNHGLGAITYRRF